MELFKTTTHTCFKHICSGSLVVLWQQPHLNCTSSTLNGHTGFISALPLSLCEDTSSTQLADASRSYLGGRRDRIKQSSNLGSQRYCFEWLTTLAHCPHTEVHSWCVYRDEGRGEACVAVLPSEKRSPWKILTYCSLIFLQHKSSEVRKYMCTFVFR